MAILRNRLTKRALRPALGVIEQRVRRAVQPDRPAGSTSNSYGKLATVPLLSPPNGAILEIGTLYGLFASALVRMVHRAGIEPDLTIIDPPAGSQLQPGTAQAADPTGTPVREDVVRANLALGGSSGTYTTRIQQGFSWDPEVREAVSDRKYGVIIVDGDHSEDGVRADLEWVDGTSRLRMLGRVSTSAFLRAD
ncbi:class I SAM-dependent methyltransferase [Streptomyces sp. NPDC006274]|uniref:class I SAM-dependent methyltransferase n=1 Tax=Streptomyces sp. NPDC006274 TaxID=3154582 RepID=UPI0033BC8480